MNKDKKVSVQQYIARREQIVIRMNEIADAAEGETRENSQNRRKKS